MNIKRANAKCAEALEEFRATFYPSKELIDQRTPYIFSKEQKEVLDLEGKVQRRIRGKAGSGKTLVLAQFAINLHKETSEEVLILCFNISLRNYIRDLISRQSQESFDPNKYKIIHFHQFINGLRRKFNIHGNKESKEDNFEDWIIALTQKDLRNFQYKTILIDEIQDFEESWQKFIRDKILVKQGYYIVVGDEKQNIYDRKLDIDKKVKVVGISGAWKGMKESQRFKGIITRFAQAFQKEFFNGKYEIDQIFDPEKITLYSENVSLKPYIDSVSVMRTIDELIYTYKINLNDIAILSDNISLLQDVDYSIRELGINTIATFEEKELRDKLKETARHSMQTSGRHLNISCKDYIPDEDDPYIEGICESIRRLKKLSFQLNSGGLKISTIHSFKGWESYAVILLVSEKCFKNKELVYVGITRAREVLYILSESAEFNDFFQKFMEKIKIG